MEKKSRKLGKKWIWIAGAVLVLGAAGVVFVLPRIQAGTSSGTSSYTTQAATKGSLSSTISASGNVYPRQSVTLNWSTSGTVSKVYVTKGQKVDKGTVLADLDKSSLSQSVLTAASDLATAQKALEDLLNSNTERAKAEQAMLTAEETLATAQKTAQSKLYARASQETVDVANANLIQAKDALEKAQETYNQISAHGTDNVQYAAALSRLATAQQSYDSASLNLQYVQSLPDALTIQQANADVDVAQAAYQDAVRAWERVKDGPTEADIEAAEAKVAAAQAVIDQQKVVAPISGTVMEIDTLPGDLVTNQTTAFVIADLSHLYIDISVSEVDISQVQLDQPASITFDAISDKTYNAKVTDIASQGTSSSGSVNFNVTTVMTDADAQVKPGLTASADITVTQKADVLLVPSSAIRTVNSQSIVYVLQSGTLTPVKITTGDTSTTQTEVASGNLKEGDLIVINPPSSTSSTSTTSMRQGGLFSGLFGGIFGGGNDRPSGIDMGGPSGMQPPSLNSQSGNNSSRNNSSSGSNSNNSGGMPQP